MCGKPTCDKLLRLQFIKRLRSSKIRTRLLQERQPKHFNEIVNIDFSIELANGKNTLKFQFTTNYTVIRRYQMKNISLRHKSKKTILVDLKIKL